MLAVLSEINCLNQLQTMEVYPDFFSTSFNEFKNHVVTFNDCTVLIILAGTNRFYRKHVVELSRGLSSYSNINKVIVITDTTIPSIGIHYKMCGNLHHLDEYNGWDLIKNKSDILTTLKGELKQPIVKLSHYDRGILHKADMDWTKRKSSEDELIALIKVPNLNSVLN